MKPKVTNRKSTPVFLTKREAVALFDGLELMFSQNPGAPWCKKCSRNLFSAIDKIDAAFTLGVTGK